MFYNKVFWESCEYSDRPHLCVYLSVCLHDKTKTTETTITKLATGIVHHESSPTINITSKVKVTKCKKY